MTDCNDTISTLTPALKGVQVRAAHEALDTIYERLAAGECHAELLPLLATLQQDALLPSIMERAGKIRAYFGERQPPQAQSGSSYIAVPCPKCSTPNYFNRDDLCKAVPVWRDSKVIELPAPAEVVLHGACMHCQYDLRKVKIKSPCREVV